MKKIYVLAFLTAFFAMNAYCQNDNAVTTNAVRGLKALSNEHIIEKAYLHFDKPYYAAGDTLYFKAYVMLGEHFDLTKASSLLHVDLIDPNNVILNSIMLPLTNGIGWGDFTLPLTYQKGNYRVRAYTRYMQNAPDYFFDQTIPIGSIFNKPVPDKAAAVMQTDKADLQFFPEGGELVSSTVSKVAFKAIGTNGLGINVKGVILDNSNAQVATFTSSHLGMGAFYLAPEEGKKYKAKVTFADGTQSTFDLPAAAGKGIVLAVKDTLDKMSIEIRSNKGYFQDNMNKNLSLVIYGGGFVNTVNAKLDSRRLSMDIANSQFPTGVVQVTLFSQTGEPLSERLVFVKGNDLLNLTVQSKKETYSKRERIKIDVNAKDKGNAAEGHFSAAVIDEGKVHFDENNETTILTYLLLSSELKGFIEQPNYYFTNNSGKTYNDLDALMLTQGYRRFDWKQMLSDNDSKFIYKPERTLEINGVAKNAAGAPVNGMDVMLLTSGTQGSVMGDRTGSDGKFKFTLSPFADNTLFTLQATGSTKTKSTTSFTVEGDKSTPAVEDKRLPGLQSDVNAAMIPYLDNSQAMHGALFNNTKAPQSNGAVHADEVIPGDELKGSASLIAALSGRLHEVNFVQNVPYLKDGKVKDPMLIVFNGKIAGSYVNLDNINPDNVSKVEVLKGRNADSYGVYGNAGVLSITANSDAAKGIIRDASYKYNSAGVVKQKNIFVDNKDNYRSSNLGGSGHADQVIHGSDIRNRPSLSSALNGLLRGIQFSNGVPYLNTSKAVMGGNEVAEPMYVVFDGNELSMNGGNGIDIINPVDVETVEVLKGPNASIYGVNGGPGVLVITSRQTLDQVENDKTALGSLAFRPKGFYKAREFYSPKYETTANENGSRDLRSTIFWQPELQTNKDGDASFEYYNADGRGTYRVVIEGVDDKGNIGRQVYRYKVE